MNLSELDATELKRLMINDEEEDGSPPKSQVVLDAAVFEEYNWRHVNLTEADDSELQRLSVKASLHRGLTEWHRVAGEMGPIEMRSLDLVDPTSGEVTKEKVPPSPWSPTVRD